MTRKQTLLLGVLAIAIVLAWAGSVVTLRAQQAASGAPRIDGDDIGGAVSGPSGPEAGAGVIAATTDLPSRAAGIVVPDDKGHHGAADDPRGMYKGSVR